MWETLRDFWETFERLLRESWENFERLLKTFERLLRGFWETETETEEWPGQHSQFLRCFLVRLIIKMMTASGRRQNVTQLFDCSLDWKAEREEPWVIWQLNLIHFIDGVDHLWSMWWLNFAIIHQNWERAVAESKLSRHTRIERWLL